MFHFRLQSVLEVRERMARLRQKDFAESLARHQTLETRIERHESDLARASRFVDNQKRSGPTITALQLFGNFQRRLQNEMSMINEQIREQAQELEASRAKLVEAKRAQRSLEILRDKARQRFEEEQSRLERVTMDEVASNYTVLREREQAEAFTDQSADG